MGLGFRDVVAEWIHVHFTLLRGFGGLGFRVYFGFESLSKQKPKPNLQPQIRNPVGPGAKALVVEWIHLKIFWVNNTHYKAKSVHLLGLMNSATKKPSKEKPCTCNL